MKHLTFHEMSEFPNYLIIIVVNLLTTTIIVMIVIIIVYFNIMSFLPEKVR